MGPLRAGRRAGADDGSPVRKPGHRAVAPVRRGGALRCNITSARSSRQRVTGRAFAGSCPPSQPLRAGQRRRRPRTAQSSRTSCASRYSPDAGAASLERCSPTIDGSGLSHAPRICCAGAQGQDVRLVGSLDDLRPSLVGVPGPSTPEASESIALLAASHHALNELGAPAPSAWPGRSVPDQLDTAIEALTTAVLGGS